MFKEHLLSFRFLRLSNIGAQQSAVTTLGSTESKYDFSDASCAGKYPLTFNSRMRRVCIHREPVFTLTSSQTLPTVLDQHVAQVLHRTALLPPPLLRTRASRPTDSEVLPTIKRHFPYVFAHGLGARLFERAPRRRAALLAAAETAGSSTSSSMVS